MATTYVDSVDKIVMTYFACVTNDPFTYKGVTYEPRPLKVSPLLLRGFTCPPACGGCCPRFSLDYLPTEPRSSVASSRTVTFNGKEFELYSDLQSDHRDSRCRNLNKENARCGIYEVRPFSCDFELIRFMVSQDDTKRSNMLSQRLFGRGWMMKRVDGGTGALCEMTTPTDETIADAVRKLSRLREWTDYFSLNTKIPVILNWIASHKTYENIEPLVLDKYGNIL